MSEQQPLPLEYAGPPPAGPPSKAEPPHPVRLVACSVVVLAGAVMIVGGVVASAIGPDTRPQSEAASQFGGLLAFIGLLAFAVEYVKGWRGAGKP